MQEYVLNHKWMTWTDKQEKKELVRISVMKKQEFANLKGNYPHRRELLHSLEYGAYCKIEVYPQLILGMLRIPDKRNLTGAADVAGFYIRKKELVFLDEGFRLEHFMEKLKTMEFTGEFQEVQFLLALFHALIDEEVPFLQKFEEKIADLEDMLLVGTPRELPRLLMSRRKEMMKLHAYYVQLIDIGEEMQGQSCELISPELAVGWSVFTNRVSRLHGYTENIRENLLQLHELYQSQIDLQQNETMAVLTVVTTVFLPLSLLAGWYGMNFPNIPLLNWKYGYLALICMMVLIIGLELRYFRKKGFLKDKKNKKSRTMFCSEKDENLE